MTDTTGTSSVAASSTALLFISSSCSITLDSGAGANVIADFEGHSAGEFGSTGGGGSIVLSGRVNSFLVAQEYNENT